MKEQQAIKGVKAFVKQQYKRSRYKNLRFHTYDQAKKIVKATMLLADELRLNEADRFIVLAAAWLFDIGYTVDSHDYQTVGKRVATALLNSLETNSSVNSQIMELLLIIPGSHPPTNLYEEILCDSTTWYLGSKSYCKINDMHRKEQSILQDQKISKYEWQAHSFSQVGQHHYFTKPAQRLWEIEKQRNLGRLKNKISERETPVSKVNDQIVPYPLLHLSKKEKNTTEKSTDTLFKIASAGNQRTSRLADNKARILITVNAIILSAIISLMLKRLDQDTYLAYPTFLLISVSLLTIVFAILAIRPHNTHGVFTQQQLETREVNLLFYGNFHHMPFNEYRNAMLNVISENERVYDTLIQDLYGQGFALNRKYGLLRMAYTVFMYGLIAAMLVFVLVTVIHYRTINPTA